MTAVAILFWLCAALIVYTHAGYPLVLRLLLALRRHPVETWPGLAEDDLPSRPAGGVSVPPPPVSPAATAPPTAAAADDAPPPSSPATARPASPPSVTLIVPAYDEQEVIAAKVANALALDYPRERLQLIVASDGSSDATAERARAAGADLVLELPAGGKVAALNAATEIATGDLLAFSDANSEWEPHALRRLVAPFADPEVGYVCGQVRFVDAGGDNLEGVYWRYEMALRQMESALGGITAGNGAIYAVRRDAYLPLAPSGSHDLSFPFELAKRGLRSLYEPAARAEEKMVPTMEGEFARKRRMMVGLWDIVVGEGMVSPRGYPPLFAFELASHRLLRYLSPALHLVVLATNAALLGQGTIYILTFLAQLALLAAALLAPRYPLAPLRVARYYVMTTASIAAGLWDRWRHGASGRWEKAEGTR
jgi:cellulose synthase/poly-beta-1,6-N-acetylglucosamine synthase-like glycosyltransferase